MKSKSESEKKENMLLTNVAICRQTTRMATQGRRNVLTGAGDWEREERLHQQRDYAAQLQEQVRLKQAAVEQEKTRRRREQQLERDEMVRTRWVSGYFMHVERNESGAAGARTQWEPQAKTTSATAASSGISTRDPPDAAIPSKGDGVPHALVDVPTDGAGSGALDCSYRLAAESGTSHWSAIWYTAAATAQPDRTTTRLQSRRGELHGHTDACRLAATVLHATIAVDVHVLVREYPVGV